MAPLGQSQWSSHVTKARAPPLSKPECDKDTLNHTVCTSGLQIWVKDVGSEATGAALALLLVNHGISELPSYSLPVRFLMSQRRLLFVLYRVLYPAIPT